MQTLLKNGAVLTMESSSILYGCDILIKAGKISAIGPGISADNAEVIDCTDKYIMPGLFDAHVHINSSEMHNLFIANGVTSVRNMWGFPKHLQWKEQSAKGEIVCPNIYTTGPLTDGLAYWEGAKVVTTPEEAETAVLQVIEQGFSYFKAYPGIPKDAFLHLLAVAKKHNFKVVGHGSTSVSWKTLADFGYYCCEHTNCLPDDESDIEYMAKSGMWLCPTHCVVVAGVEYFYNQKPLSEYPYKEYLTKGGMEFWENITEFQKAQGRWDQITERNADASSPLTMPYTMENLVNRALAFIRTAGADKIILGTDTPNPGVVAGFTIHEELQHMVKVYKLSNYEAIKAGTVNAAKHLGIEKEKGKLAKGFDADILIINGNPVRDVKNISKIHAVIKGGRVFNRTELDAMLEAVRTIDDKDVIYV